MKPHDSEIFKEFKEAIKIALDQKVAEKQINIKEIVQSSTSKLDLRDHLSVLEEFNTFLNENGEKTIEGEFTLGVLTSKKNWGKNI